MSIDAKSNAAAAALNDTFKQLGWDAFMIKAYATNETNRVDVEYISDGFRRRVACDPIAMQDWLKKHSEQRMLWCTLESILDKKPESPKPPVQDELDLGNLSPITRRAMRPE